MIISAYLDRVDTICLALVSHRFYRLIHAKEGRPIFELAPRNIGPFLSFYPEVPVVRPYTYCNMLARLALFLPTNDLLACLKNTRLPWPSEALRDRFKQAISIRRGVLKAKVQTTSFRREILRHNQHGLAERVHGRYIKANARWYRRVLSQLEVLPNVLRREEFAKYSEAQEFLRLSPKQVKRDIFGLLPDRRIRVLRELHFPRQILARNDPKTTGPTIKQLFDVKVASTNGAFSKSILKEWFQMDVEVATDPVLIQGLDREELWHRLKVFRRTRLESNPDPDDHEDED